MSLMRKFHRSLYQFSQHIYLFHSYNAAEQSRLGFKLFLSLDMSYVLTLPQPSCRPVIYRSPFPSAPCHVLLLMMPRLCVILLTHTFLTLINYNMPLAPSSPPFLAKPVPLDNQVFRMAGRASSLSIQTLPGKFTLFLHSLSTQPPSPILPMSWMVISM